MGFIDYGSTTMKPHSWKDYGPRRVDGIFGYPVRGVHIPLVLMGPGSSSGSWEVSCVYRMLYSGCDVIVSWLS